jgi:hypothetical protein
MITTSFHVQSLRTFPVLYYICGFHVILRVDLCNVLTSVSSWNNLTWSGFSMFVCFLPWYPNSTLRSVPQHTSFNIKIPPPLQ